MVDFKNVVKRGEVDLPHSLLTTIFKGINNNLSNKWDYKVSSAGLYMQIVFAIYSPLLPCLVWVLIPKVFNPASALIWFKVSWCTKIATLLSLSQCLNHAVFSPASVTTWFKL